MKLKKLILTVTLAFGFVVGSSSIGLIDAGAETTEVSPDSGDVTIQVDPGGSGGK